MIQLQDKKKNVIQPRRIIHYRMYEEPSHLIGGDSSYKIRMDFGGATGDNILIVEYDAPQKQQAIDDFHAIKNHDIDQIEISGGVN